MNDFKLKLLQDKTQMFTKENILNLNSYNQLLFALKKKISYFF